MNRRTAIAAALRQLAAAVELDDEQPAPAPANDAGPELLSAKALGVATRTLRRAGERDELTVYRVGRELMARRVDALAWLETRRLSARRSPVVEQLDDDSEDIASAMVARGLARRVG